MKKNFVDFVTCGQMKLLEERADKNGLSYYQMMENAGRAAAQVIMERVACEETMRNVDASSEQMRSMAEVAEKDAADLYAAEGDGAKKQAMIFCGKGNNGGDGFVVARILCRQGYNVVVILVDGEPKTKDGIANFELLKELPVRIIDMNENNRALIDLKLTPDVIVDAMYGTGFKGKLRNNALKAAIYINNRYKGTDNVILMKQATVAALDIPSGLGGDMVSDKELDPCTVTAHCTITFHAKKPVHLQPFAPKYCGEITVADIGIDAEKLWGNELS